MTRKCIDTKPCKLSTCYNCRCALINATAQHMIDVGAFTSEQADGYRYRAIGDLQFEQLMLEAQAPKPKARKASPAVDTAYAAQLLETLRLCQTRENGERLLAGRTVAMLREVARLAEHRPGSKLRKAEVVAFLVEGVIGYRLDSEAIRKGAMGI